MTRIHVTSPYAEAPGSRPAAGSPPRVPVLTQYLVLGCAAGTTALLAATGVIAAVESDAIMSWWRSPSPRNDTLELMAGLEGLTALTNLVAFVATGLWLLRIRALAEWASPISHHSRSPYWAFLGWVVPVVHLWYPYQVVADASRGIGSSVRTFWPWWLAWLALSNYSVVSALGGEVTTATELQLMLRTQQLGAVVALVAFVLWWRVVRSATRAAAEAVSEVRVPS